MNFRLPGSSICAQSSALYRFSFGHRVRLIQHFSCAPTRKGAPCNKTRESLSPYRDADRLFHTPALSAPCALSLPPSPLPSSASLPCPFHLQGACVCVCKFCLTRGSKHSPKFIKCKSKVSFDASRQGVQRKHSELSAKSKLRYQSFKLSKSVVTHIQGICQQAFESPRHLVT